MNARCCRSATRWWRNGRLAFAGRDFGIVAQVPGLCGGLCGVGHRDWDLAANGWLAASRNYRLLDHLAGRGFREVPPARHSWRVGRVSGDLN
jgi:hypothetical protein